ncbi:MAG: FliM/FliN family flagellar motor switch protein [Gemmatimonadetes bacterium]|nr:FliM/FliN family flagellar motor switch protein [Gemmatimonadota bacterium]
MSETTGGTGAAETAVDAAMDAASTPAPDATTRGGAEPVGPPLYDFQRPVGMAEQTRRLLDLGFAEVAASLEGWIGAQVREPLEVSVELLEESRFGLFRRELDRPATVFLLAIEEGPEQGAIQLDTELAFRLLERTLGSELDHVFIPERPLTWIERAVLREVLSQGSEIISRAWREHIPLNVGVAGFESVPEMLPQGNQDATLHARLRIAAAEWVTSMSIVLPVPVVSAALATRRDERPALEPVVVAENRQRLESALKGADLEVSVRLPTFPVSLRDVSSLEVGRHVQSALPADTEVEIYLSDELRFVGRMGRQGEHLAVEILRPIPPGGERPGAY